MTTGAAEPAKLDIADIAKQTLSIIRLDLKAYVYMAGLLAVLPAAALGLLASVLGMDAEADGRHGMDLVLSLLGVVLSGALAVAASRRLNGDAPAADDAIRTGFNVFLPLFAVSLLTALGMLAGLILLVVPGLILATVWAAVVPVVVLERTKVFETFRRSAQLTKGHRLQIFLLGLLAALGGAGLVMVGGLASLINNWVAEVIILPVLTGLLATLIGVGGTVLYAELKARLGAAA